MGDGLYYIANFTRGVSIRFSGKRKPEEKVKNIRCDFKFILNFTFLETVPVVRKSGSRFVECSRKVNGCDFDVYCPMFPAGYSISTFERQI